MAAPSYLNTGFRRLALTGVTDVQTIMDAVEDEVKNQLPVADRWIEPVADTYQTPNDSVGRFFKVLLSRVSQTRMGFHVKNQNGTTIRDGTIDISGTASARIWSGPFHLYVEAQSGAAYEVARASMVDPRPEPLNSHAFYVVVNTHRDSGGTAGSGDLPDNWFMQDPLAIQETSRGALLSQPGSGVPGEYKCHSGEDLATGCRILRAGAIRSAHAGYLFQAVWLDATNSAGAQVSVPIDDGATGTFEVMGLLTWGNYGKVRLAVRAG